MRAAILREYGKPPEPGQADEPTSSGEQVVLDVEAGGLNPVDIRMASGNFYGGSPPLPSVAGREGVGRTPDGELVYFDAPVAPHGSFAERTLVERANLIPLGADVDPGLAVAFGIAGLAGWLALQWRAQVREGETVLVLGASGVVGQIAVQGARLLGAGRVVAAARSKVPVAADAVVDLSQTDGLVDALRDACDGGADVVIDPVWGDPAAAAIDACNPNARLIQIGESAGATATLSSASIRGRLIAILGHTNFRAPADVKRDAYRQMVAHAAKGELAVEVERVPIEDVGDAWERQQHSPNHKLVIVPR
jgi:NADPH:quinone reductase-like Zn-dependent oxidoreductase